MRYTFRLFNVLLLCLMPNSRTTQKSRKKSYFSTAVPLRPFSILKILNGRPFTSPPPPFPTTSVLMARTLKKRPISGFHDHEQILIVFTFQIYTSIFFFNSILFLIIKVRAQSSGKGSLVLRNIIPITIFSLLLNIPRSVSC